MIAGHRWSLGVRDHGKGQVRERCSEEACGNPRKRTRSRLGYRVAGSQTRQGNLHPGYLGSLESPEHSYR